MPPTQLLKLVAALLDDKELRQRFNEHPKDVMNEFALGADEKSALLTMDPGTIATEVTSQFPAFETEIGDADVEQGEFPPCSEDYKPELGSTETEYPTPTPGVYRVRPRKVTSAELAAAGQKLEVIITGKSFSRDPDATVKVFRISDSTEWSVSSELFGTFRCSRLRAVVAPKPGETKIAIGKYQIRVVNNGVVIQRVRPNPATDPDFEVA